MSTHAQLFGRRLRTTATVSFALTAAALSVALGAGPAAAAPSVPIPPPANTAEQAPGQTDQTQKPTTANVTGRVWEDVNHNGLQDEGEDGVQGALILVLSKDADLTDLPKVVAKVRIDHSAAALTKLSADNPGYLHGLSLQDGSYKVADVPAGTVRILAIAAGINVKTQQPTKWYFTQQVKGHPDTDSDFTPKTDNVMHTLHFGEINKVQTEAGKDLVLDAGVIDPAKPANNGVACVRAWDDKNRNGLRDKGEAPIAGLPVDVSSEVESTQPATTKGTVKSLSRVITARGTVARKPGTKEDIPVTDAKGSYCFSDRRAGKYKALIGLGPVVYDANGTPDIAKIWTLTIHNAAGNTKDAIDSDFVLAGGKDIPARLAGKVGVSDKFKVKDDNTTVVDAGMWRNETTPTPSSSPAPPTPTPTTAPGGGGGPLPTTGAALTGILGAGVLLVGGGIAMTAFARRRRRTAA